MFVALVTVACTVFPMIVGAAQRDAPWAYLPLYVCASLVTGGFAGGLALLVAALPRQSALASLDCRLEEMIQRHSHVIVIGHVLYGDVRGGSDSLLHWRGDYARLQASSPRPN